MGLYVDLLITDNDLTLDPGGEPLLCDDRDSIEQDIKHLIRESGLMVIVVAERSFLLVEDATQRLTVLIEDDERLEPGTVEILRQSDLKMYFVTADTIEFGPLGFALAILSSRPGGGYVPPPVIVPDLPPAVTEVSYQYVMARPTIGYLSSALPVAAGNPIADMLSQSPFRLSEIANDAVTFTDATPLPTYAGVVAAMTVLDAAYAQVVKEVIGQSYGGRDIVAIRLFDDGTRPIFGISNGIHGDERDAAFAVEEFVKNVLTSNDPVYAYARAHFAIYVIATANPDGMASTAASTHGGTGTRNNANNVNLNRNWPYYWETVADLDKGATPASEPETQAIIAWLTTHNPQRIKSWVDTHGWNSRNEWGFLCEQIYHDYNVQKIQRASYHYTQSLLSTRNYPVGLTFAPSGTGRPKLVESRSRRKPYIYTWIQQAAQGNCFACVIEYPQIENVGLVNAAMADVYKGQLAGACDGIQTEVPNGGAIPGFAVLKAYTPINNNSLLTAWNSAESRPDWFSLSGLRATHFPGVDRSYVRLLRPDDELWPLAVAESGYCVANDGAATDAFYVAGGHTGTTTVATVYGENLVTGAKAESELLPVALRDGAMAYHAGYLYFCGGFKSSDNTYSTAVYRISTTPNSAGSLTGWQKITDIPVGLQRHTVNVWNGKLVIAGGRDSVGYKTDVRLYDIATDTWSVLANFTTARGWHTAAVYNDTLYIFGGWGGSTAFTTVRKINLNTGATSNGTALLAARAEQAIAVKGSVAYLIGGRSDATTNQKEIWAYDMATDTIANVNYVLEQSNDTPDHDPPPPIPDPLIRSASAFYHSTDDYLGIIGGIDGSGVASPLMYEYHFADNTLYTRASDVLTWGYLRTSSAHTGAPGDAFSVNAALRNPIAVTHDKNPYARITVIIGPLANPQRKLRSGYFVPPQDEFRTYNLPFILQPGETEFRAYLRHYGGGTEMDVAAFQVVPELASGFIVPQTGGGGGTLTETFNPPVGFAGDPHKATGTFSCIFGSQQTITQLIFGVTFADNPNNALLEVWYEAVEDYNNGVIVNPAFPDIIAYPPTGRLFARIGQIGLTSDVDIFEVGEFELNHAKLNREWRLDTIDWELVFDGTEAWIGFSFYGRHQKIGLPIAGTDPYYAGVSAVGLSSSNSGVIFSAKTS